MTFGLRTYEKFNTFTYSSENNYATF